MWDDEDGGSREEENIRNIGRENIDGAPLGGTAMADLMVLSPSPAEYRPTKKRPAQRIRHRITAAATVYLTTYRKQYVSGRPRQQRRMTATMEREKRWELAQIESHKKDNTKLTPIPFNPRKVYCMTITFARFVCALLSFCAHEFPAKSETREPRKIIMECTLHANETT